MQALTHSKYEKLTEPLPSQSSFLINKKESLMTTTISTYTQEIFNQASLIKSQLTTNYESNVTEIQQASKALLVKIQILFNAHRFSNFQITEKKSKNKGLDKSNPEERLATIQRNCENIIKLCRVEDQDIKDTWLTKDLELLTKYSKKFILDINVIFQKHSLPSIKIKEETTAGKLVHKIKEKIYHYQLSCTFQTEQDKKQWDKVEKSVENYFNMNILIKTNEVKDYDPKLDEKPISDLLGLRFLLKHRMDNAEIEEDLKSLQLDLDRNEIHILEAYQIKLLELAKALKNPKLPSLINNQLHINALQEIFKTHLKDSYTESLGSTFLCAISNSLTTHYIEGYLEDSIIDKIIEVLQKWKKEGNNNPLDYTTLENSHWDRLLTSTVINTAEMKRALLNACIWIRRNKDKHVLLHPPAKTNSTETPEKETKKINEYLPSTEQLISKHIGDPSGTVLTRFREIGYQLLQSQKPQVGQIEKSILEIDEQMFNAFAPIMRKLENAESLSYDEASMLTHVENELRKTNSEIINKHGIRKIARLLFSFHRVLNQCFMTGTLTTLKSVLKYIYPKDQKGLTSLAENESSLFVDLGENEEIALEWQMTNQLCSEDWLLTQTLRIELPPMGSLKSRGKVTQEFKAKTSENYSKVEKTQDIEKFLLEEREVLETIAHIRHILKAMQFPLGSFNKEN